MKKLMFTLALLSAFTGQAQAELKWKKMQAGASGGMNVSVIAPNIVIGDYSVKLTGHNLYGQLGDGTTAGIKSTPVISAGFNGATQCSAGDLHTVCVMNDGTVKVAGYNLHGQLGIITNSGSTVANSTPITAPAFANAKECSANGCTVCVMNDGTVKVAGHNRYGQLGTTTNSGTNNANPNPITIAGFNDAKKCSAGGEHTVCVMNDGSVKVAGSNEYGQLGTTTNSGTTTPNPNPITIASFEGFKECSAGSMWLSHMLCIQSGTREELPTCDSLTDFFGKTADGTKYICKGNLWTKL